MSSHCKVFVSTSSSSFFGLPHVVGVSWLLPSMCHCRIVAPAMPKRGRRAVSPHIQAPPPTGCNSTSVAVQAQRLAKAYRSPDYTRAGHRLPVETGNVSEEPRHDL